MTSKNNFNNNNKQINIYCNPNKYGYKLNINHPYINSLYVRYCKWKNILLTFPLTDQQRFEFEQYVIDTVLKPKQAKDN